MITQVALEHWRSHLNTEFSFGPGVNVLVGMMGGGKSSTMDAVCFALFGTFPALQQRRVGIDDLLSQLPQQRDAGSVRVCFERNGKRYEVIRRIARGHGTVEAELREDGALREANPENVSREVERVLGVDYDLFAKAVYAEQNGVDSFLRLPRGQRTTQIDRMLQVESFAKMRESGIQLANTVASARQAEQRLLQEVDVGAEQKLMAAADALAAAKAASAAATTRLHQAEQEAARTAMLLRELEAAAERQRNARLARERAAATLAERRRQLTDLRTQISIAVPVADAQALEQLRNELLAAERTTAAAAQESLLLEQRLAQLNTSTEACPVCSQPLPEDRKRHVAAERTERLAELAAAQRRAAAESLRLRTGIRNAEAELRAAERASAQRAAAERTAAIVEKAIAELEREAAAASGVDADEPMLATRRAEAARAMAAAAAGAAEERAARALVEDSEDWVNEWRDRVAQAQRMQERVAESTELEQQLRRFIGALEGAQEQLRNEYLGEVNRAMNAVWAELYPYADFTELRLRREGDYLLELKGPAGWIAADGVASGGERSLAALALRIAFSLAFAPQLRWLVLDEPTHNLDAAAVRLLADALRERLGGLVEQAFVITHDERIAEAGATVYRLERDAEKRLPTRAVAV